MIQSGKSRWQAISNSFTAHSPSLQVVFYFLLLGSLCYAQGLYAQSNLPAGAKGTVEKLTQVLIDQHMGYQRSDRSQQPRLLDQLIETAVDRQRILLSIIEQEPAEVIRLSLAPAIRDGMPIEVQAYIEEEVEIEGEIEILHEDRVTGSRILYHLKTPRQQYSLQFAKDPPTYLTTGAKVRVRGVRVSFTLALNSGRDSVETLATTLPNALGEQKTLVVLVNFKNKVSEPYTTNYANDVIFGTTNNFIWENSYQQTFLSGVIKGWFTIDMNSPTNSANCNYSLIASLADQAAADAGVALSDYSRKIYAFPTTGCTWWGLSTVGGNPSQAWINGNLELRVVAHELGHGFGLYHSHSLDCGTTAVIGPSCTPIEYGNIVDMMGSSPSAHFNAFQKERLGWLNAGASPPIATVETSGTHSLRTFESSGPEPRALKILKSTDNLTGAKTWYYLESRQAIGFDAFLANEPSQNILNGVLVHFGSEDNGNSSHLLDMTPATPVYYWWYDPALAVGQNYQDPNAGVSITTNWVSGGQASVAVQFFLGMSVSTDKPSYARGQTVYITANVISGGKPVPKTTVTFATTKANGSLVTGTATTASNGNAVYKLRLAKNDPLGIYGVVASAAKNGLSGNATTEFRVQ